MKHRIFLAINLPKDVKDKLSEYEIKFSELPCRWTRKANLHITLVFLGYITDEELLEICKITKETVSKHEPFSIILTKILYGPPQKPSRMVWAEGEKSEQLGKLQRDLQNSLGGLPTGEKEEKGRAYAPHITLGRLKQWEFRRMEPEERPEVNEEISPPVGGLSFEVNSIEIMESQLKRGGPEYMVLESAPLKL